MSLNSSSNDLTEIGERFLNWKQLHPHRHIPKPFWDDAIALISKYNLYDVARTISCSPQYLHLKQKKRLTVDPSQIHFVEIESSQIADPTQIKLHIHGHKGLAIDISFQGNVDQIFPLISSLIKEENACYK